MDRARGKFNRGRHNSSRDQHVSRSGDDGAGSFNGGRPSSDPRMSGNGQPSSNPTPGPSGSNNPMPYHQNGGERQKRSRAASVASDSKPGKRQRSEPAHGQASKRIVRIDLDETRPANVAKSGHGTTHALGQQIIPLKANYFTLTNRPNFVVYQYHVDIEPEINSTAAKKGIFYECTKDIQRGKIFDGSTLYTTQMWDEDLNIIQGTHKRRDSPDEGTPVTIKIKFIKEVTSFQELPLFQILNTVMRQALKGLNLQLVGRNYFNPGEKTKIHQLRLEVWPGYITSIRQHDSSILLCCDTTSKVMRNENLYTILKRCQANHRDYKSVYEKEVLGITVLTDYNNKTYRVNDIDWDQNPQSTFETNSGPKSYMQYYGEVRLID